MTQHIALVTGAMGGIGTAVCVELAKAGHKVVAAYHRQFDKPEAWLAEQKAAGFDFIVPVPRSLLRQIVCAGPGRAPDCQVQVCKGEHCSSVTAVLR